MNVLSLNGGGIRGIMQAVTLARVESVSGTRLHRLFDLIVGTSTGGILAIGLGLGLSANRIVEFYMDEGRNIFPRWTWRPLALFGSRYSSKDLRASLEKAFGTLEMGEMITKVMVTATRVRDQKSMLYRSWVDKRLACVDAAAATAAAPTYFEPATVYGERVVDGGVWANCPAMVAATEAKNLGVPYFNLVSMDTGRAPEQDWKPENSGLLAVAPKMADLFMDSGMDAAEYMASVWAHKFVPIRLRMGTASGKMDDARETNIDDMIFAAQADADRNARRILEALG